MERGSEGSKYYVGRNLCIVGRFFSVIHGGYPSSPGHFGPPAAAFEKDSRLPWEELYGRVLGVREAAFLILSENNEKRTALLNRASLYTLLYGGEVYSMGALRAVVKNLPRNHVLVIFGYTSRRE